MDIEFSDKPLRESINPEHHHCVRPLCACCGGGDHRKGYKHTKAKSYSDNRKNRKAKPKNKDHR